MPSFAMCVFWELQYSSNALNQPQYDPLYKLIVRELEERE